VRQSSGKSFLAASVEERFREMAAAIASSFSLRDLSIFADSFPTVSGPPGLRALVDPEGVTLRVLDGSESQVDVLRIVIQDMVEKYLKPRMMVKIARGATSGEVGVDLYKVSREMQSRYRIELLDGSGTGGRSKK